MSDAFDIDLKAMKRFTHGKGPIVIVDDDESQILLVKTCYKMSQRQNELICLLSGDEFLEYTDKVISGDKEMPEVVLLDINMPKKDGFEVLKKIRSIQSFKEIPVIIMFTTSSAERDKKKAIDLKANAFFSKPSRISDYVTFFASI